MTEAIKVRHSVRTFKGQLEPSRRAIVDRIIEEVQKIEVPFHTSAEVADAPAGLGKHGLIKNEAGWLLAKIPVDAANDPRYIYDAAYRMHTFVLKMTQHILHVYGLEEHMIGMLLRRQYLDSQCFAPLPMARMVNPCALSSE